MSSKKILITQIVSPREG